MLQKNPERDRLKLSLIALGMTFALAGCNWLESNRSPRNDAATAPTNHSDTDQTTTQPQTSTQEAHQDRSDEHGTTPVPSSADIIETVNRPLLFERGNTDSNAMIYHTCTAMMRMTDFLDFN